jgi:hypothetical protein
MINALLGQERVIKSSGSGACTSFAIFIEYLDGAPDNTKPSFIEIQTLDEDNLWECIVEQIMLYAAAHLYREILDQGNEEANLDIPSQLKSGTQPQEERFDAVHTSTRHGAGTARDFFEIIFGTKSSNPVEVELDHLLQDTDITNDEDIKNGRFFKRYMAEAEKCLQRLSAEIGVYSETLENVPDKDLRKLWKIVQKFWPLVDCIVLETGRPLLRHNVGIMDLPNKCSAS